MKITKYKLHGNDELIRVMKNTTLRGDSDIKPYANARITIQTAHKNDIVPTQRFVLQEQLDTIANLSQAFRKKGVDILRNNGFITYLLGQNRFTFTPPIVEVINGEPLLIDGMHRIIHAGNRPFSAIFIEGVPAEFLPYQIGLEHGWGEVVTFKSEVPRGFPRKERRYPRDVQRYFFREYPFPGMIKIIREHSMIR